ncbi:sensor histidine kinase [Amycolatopsis sp. BJA-103]|uniref:sensor histidine kinase n=1 Tax=Amycolatopsis sp. BJA-103 TaxID=1911175 RepID=UPI000C766D63|nr:sensor histidine kinase [Amycolatopsis sp. BJA-103]AUI58760.1 two-component sensor histidine kinase [Amycolatopsis sp. BJA-103]PNE17789.1 two-component sensor histidine kinase [Amycolatopsis sp. BJA-103]
MSVEPEASPVVTVLSFVLLAILTAFTFVADGPLVKELVLCGVAAGWMLGMLVAPRSWRSSLPVTAVFLGVLTAITLVLVVEAPWFGCFTPVLYVYAFRLLPWPWLVPGVAAAAVVAGTAQAYGVDKTTVAGVLSYLAVLAANIGPMCAFAWFAWRGDERNRQREEALRELAEANSRLEASLAENAALHEQLLARARETAVHGERERMAREIHDTLAQGLTGIITQLQAAEHDPDSWRRRTTAATALARESLTEARRSVHALRPEPLRTSRLGEALDGVAERWSALHGVAVRVTTTGTAVPLSPETEVALLRTAQEALANVANHARATRAGVTLSYLEGEVAVDVRDDGRGFDPLSPRGDTTGTGFGLTSMRQRIESLAGTLRIESEPGGGTGISACVPLGETHA